MGIPLERGDYSTSESETVTGVGGRPVVGVDQWQEAWEPVFHREHTNVRQLPTQAGPSIRTGDAEAFPKCSIHRATTVLPSVYEATRCECMEILELLLGVDGCPAPPP